VVWRSHSGAPVLASFRVRPHRLSTPSGWWPTGSRCDLAIDATSDDRDVADDHVWSLILAGGEGTRLLDYVRERFGRPLPKQYCTFTGTRSMLEHTADRARRFAPPSRTVTVVGARHKQVALPQLEGRSDHVVWQPANRDTGPGLFFPLSFVYRWDPDAVVAIFPADHYVAPESRFAEVLGEALRLARRWPDRVITLGVTPDEPDSDYGYVTLGRAAAGAPGLRTVEGFVEKPDLATARRLCGAGALWNTMITCATASALWELARATQPAMMELFDAFVPLIDDAEENEAVNVMFRELPTANLSRDLFERAPERLLALPLDGVTWSDWGRPERIEAVLAAGRLAARAATVPAAFGGTAS